MISLQHLLAAVDLGPATARVLSATAELAAPFGAKITVIHVIEPPSGFLDYPVSAELRAAARLRLEAAIEPLRARGIAVESLLVAGDATEEILRAVGEVNADLVVAATHRRHGTSHVLLGSVTQRLVAFSSVPILTLHPWWFESRRDAGRALAERARELPNRPVVIAISDGAVLVAAEIAEALGTPMDVLLASPLLLDGLVVGGACEDGSARFDPSARLTKEASRELSAATSDALQTEALRLRGATWIGDVWRRDVLLVADRLDEPWSMLAAAQALRQLGPTRIIAAAPLATTSAFQQLTTDLGEVIALHTIDDPRDASSTYPESDAPPTPVIVEALRQPTASRRERRVTSA